MCGIALPIAALALTAVGTGVAAYSAYQQQSSANQAAKYNADMQNRNAQVANLQAQTAIQEGQVAENEHRQLVQRTLGAQRAGGAGSGLLVDDGSNLDLQKDTAGYGELDALTIRNNAGRQAWGLQNESANYTAQGQLDLAKQGNPALAGSGSLLSGMSQLGQQYYAFKQQGAFNSK